VVDYIGAVSFVGDHFDLSVRLRIPADAGHQFRSMPGQHSGPCRATVPVDAGRGCDAG
jgi:hypothetical protein